MESCPRAHGGEKGVDRQGSEVGEREIANHHVDLDQASEQRSDADRGGKSMAVAAMAWSFGMKSVRGGWRTSLAYAMMSAAVLKPADLTAFTRATTSWFGRACCWASVNTLTPMSRGSAASTRIKKPAPAAFIAMIPDRIANMRIQFSNGSDRVGEADLFVMSKEI